LAVNFSPSTDLPLREGCVEFVGATDNFEVAPNVRPTKPASTDPVGGLCPVGREE
jgi:hypothetical protein